MRVSLLDGTTQFVNAGHPWPLLLRQERVEEVVPEVDLPFGIQLRRPGPSGGNSRDHQRGWGPYPERSRGRPCSGRAGRSAVGSRPRAMARSMYSRAVSSRLRTSLIGRLSGMRPATPAGSSVCLDLSSWTAWVKKAWSASARGIGDVMHSSASALMFQEQSGLLWVQFQCFSSRTVRANVFSVLSMASSTISVCVIGSARSHLSAISTLGMKRPLPEGCGIAVITSAVKSGWPAVTGSPNRTSTARRRPTTSTVRLGNSSARSSRIASRARSIRGSASSPSGPNPCEELFQ
ncbi:hypothetical protein OG827_06900 [Streptomyces sp. NBC_00272]